MIIYENGRREKFNVDFISSEQSQTNPDNNVTDSKKMSRKLKNNKNYGAVGLGLGISYAGAFGVKVQYAFGDKFKFGPHAALGFLSGNVTYSAGVSFYLHNFYLDLIYGPVAYEDYYGDGDYEKVYFGPSWIIGYDWYFSDHFGLNLGLGASYWEGDGYNFDEDIFLGLDLGFKYKFN